MATKSRFSRAAPATKSPQAFINGAGDGTPDMASKSYQNDISMMPSELDQAEKRPWDGLDPKATARIVFNLRFNEYEMAILRYVNAQDEDLSMHKIVKRIVMPKLRVMAGIDKD